MCLTHLLNISPTVLELAQVASTISSKSYFQDGSLELIIPEYKRFPGVVHKLEIRLQLWFICQPPLGCLLNSLSYLV